MIFGPEPDEIERLRAWNPRPHTVTAALAKIDELQAEVARLRARPCPYVRQADEGTAYCSLAERRAE